MDSSEKFDVWTVNIYKLVLHSGGTMLGKEILTWVKDQAKKKQIKVPNIKQKIQAGLGKYFSVSNPANALASDISVVAPSVCKKHWKNDSSHDPGCTDIHICKYFILDNCRSKSCKFAHSFQDSNTSRLIKANGLGFLSEEELKLLLKRQVNLPEICKFYNSDKGCQRPPQKPCLALHVCSGFLTGTCDSDICNLCHNVLDKQPRAVLKGLCWDLDREQSSIEAELRRRYQEADRPIDQASGQQCKSDRKPSSSYSRNASTIQTPLPSSEDARQPRPQDVDSLPPPQQARQPRSQESGGLPPSQDARQPRSQESGRLPQICKFYNNEGGCKRTAEKPCRALHLCSYFVKGQCKFNPCKRSHSVHDGQPLQVLSGLGWKVQTQGEQILAALRERHGASDNRGVQRQAQQRRPPSPPQAVPSDAAKPQATSTDRVGRQKSESEDLAEVRICIYFLKGRCSYDNKCRNMHSKKPYQWQYSDRDQGRETWHSFLAEDNEGIEMLYGDVTQGNAHAEIGQKGSSITVEIDFDRQEYRSPLVSGRVRRLGTYSWGEAALTRPYVTRWLWYWQDERGEWRMYGAEEDNISKASITSKDIEEKFLEKEEVTFQAGIHKYEINFKEMNQRNIKYGTKRPLRRRPDSQSKQDAIKSELATVDGAAMKSVEIVFPPTWNIKAVSSDSEYQLVEVLSSGPDKKEWDEVSALISQTLQGVTVKKIQRNQNYELWEDFVRKRAKMEKSRKSGEKTVKELQLFHGTRSDSIEPICRQGFDFRLAGSAVGTLYGKGSYFASKASYSVKYTESNKLFVVRVLVGDYTKGSSTYTRPPPKNPDQRFGELYDSCVDKESDPTIYVVFERTQSYPEYIVEI